jgi:hypothetical protein
MAHTFTQGLSIAPIMRPLLIERPLRHKMLFESVGVGAIIAQIEHIRHRREQHHAYRIHRR